MNIQRVLTFVGITMVAAGLIIGGLGFVDGVTRSITGGLVLLAVGLIVIVRARSHRS